MIGTLLAILTTTVSYIVFALLSGSETLRDAFGPIMGNGSVLINDTDRIAETWEFAGNDSGYCMNGEVCKWGSHNSFQVVNLKKKLFGERIHFLYGSLPDADLHQHVFKFKRKTHSLDSEHVFHVNLDGNNVV